MILETAFLIVTLNGPVMVQPQFQGMFADNVIPPQVVRECTEYTGVDPYNVDHLNDIYKELDLLDCYFYDVGAHEHNIYSE